MVRLISSLRYWCTIILNYWCIHRKKLFHSTQIFPVARKNAFVQLCKSWQPFHVCARNSDETVQDWWKSKKSAGKFNFYKNAVHQNILCAKHFEETHKQRNKSCFERFEFTSTLCENSESNPFIFKGICDGNTSKEGGLLDDVCISKANRLKSRPYISERSVMPPLVHSGWNIRVCEHFLGSSATNIRISNTLFYSTFRLSHMP